MQRKAHNILLLATLIVSFALSADAAVVINEIFYRPGTAFPENTALEFIELLNTDAVPIDVSGWAFTKGIAFTFPAGTSIPAGGYVVVAATPGPVQAAFGITGVFGPWAAGSTLSNRDETIELSKPGAIAGTWEEVDDVHYASEGDWATRVRENTFGGWAWSTPANGGGKSMELRNAAVSNDNGQNWAPSTATAGGTPGTANSVRTANIAPIIHELQHSPAVPKSTEPVTISCKLNDETAPTALSANLFWRNATNAAPGAFQSMPMTGDGAGKFSATLGALPDLSIVEFYISASDGTNTRTWPAPTSEGQNANAQYQVSDEVLGPNESYYFLVLSGAENAAYNAIAPQDSAGNKIDREFNTTVIAAGGTGASIRYRSSIRFRGNSSRSYQFKPLRVSIPLDNRLEGVSDFNLHPRGSYLQYIGFRIFQAGGVRVEDAVPVEVRRNGVEYTTSTGGSADYGKWVRVEDIGGDFVDNHWPEANGGNAYRKTRPDQFWRSTQPAPTNPDDLLDGWSKQNNGAANDWSDLRGFFQAWQTAAAPHFTGENPGDVNSGTWNGTAFTDSEVATLATVSDFDQWARWFAVMTILEDNETNISNGQDDDYAAYFVPGPGTQRRMDLIPHDLDTVLGRGDSPIPPDAHGLYDMTGEDSVFTTLLPLFGNTSAPGNAAFRTKYFTAIRELYGGVLNADTSTNPNPPFYAFLDNHLGGWVPAAAITAMKTFATQRQAYLLGLIGSGAITPPAPTSSATLTVSHGPLMISEVLAHNVAAVQNGATFPDIIELHNSDATPVDVSGMSLTDDPALPAQFVFPAGTTIPAGGFLVVYADEDVAAPGLHTGFALDQDGDELRLYNGATLVDVVTFGPQAQDLSISRTGAGLDVWALTAPSLGTVNTAAVALGNLKGVLINELFSNPDYLSSDDFAELYNPAAQPVALGGVTITDDFINYPAIHALPALSFIGARGFLVVRPKGSAASPRNPTELPFKFSSTSTAAAILGANGTIIDQLDTDTMPPDVSRGRSPDGAAALSNFGLPTNIPTPGAPNVAPPALILALLNNLRVSELLYKPNNLEYVELQNIGSAPLDISGVRFTSGITYTFGPGTTLAPGAFIVVCKDRAAFIAQFGASVPLAPGVFAGTLDNAGERIAFQPPLPWNVNILSFAYSSTWYPETDADHSLVVIDPGGTLARDWDQKETWRPSGQLYGNPGLGLPPLIISPLAATGVIDTPFSYQIQATQSPTSYSAVGLPNGVVLNATNGLISGTPTQSGVFDVTIGIANAVGTDSKTLRITINAFGPLTGFDWAPIGAQIEGVPFAVTLRAHDAAGRTVATFNGGAQVSARRLVTGAASVVLTEVGTTTPTPDYFEIQNVGSASANTNGWFVLTSRSSMGVNSPSTTAWSLPATLTAAQIVGATDSPNLAPTETDYGPGGIDWPSGTSGWVMLVDAAGVIRDFVAWGFSASEIASINFTHAGFNLSVGPEWSGNGAVAPPGGQSLFRAGTGDTNSASDWSLATTPDPRGTQNSGLTLPWSTFVPVAGSPSGTVNFVDGMWNGPFTVLEIANSVELQAVITGQPVIRSNTFAVSMATVNTPPAFTGGGDQTVPEDAGLRTVQWATGIRPGASSESGQTVTFIVANDNNALFSVQPALQSNGTLTFTPAAEMHGMATVTVQAKDNGGTANGGVDTSAPQTFTITVLSVNDAPTITIPGNISANQLAGPQTLPGWATGIGSGSADEAGEILTIEIATTNSQLFAVPPALANDGTLTFTPAGDTSGTANVTITVRDNGGTANGGVATTQRMFTITVLIVNKAPSFTAGSNVTVPVASSYSQAWATNISPGGADESGQTFVFSVTNDRPDLFAFQPTISSAGVLAFTSGNVAGTATLTVILRDSGGTAEGGVDTSAPQTFTVQLTAVAAAEGKYHGLIEPPAMTAAENLRMGGVEFALTRTGHLSGKLTLAGQSFPVKAVVDDSGAANFGRGNTVLVLVRKGLSPLQLRIQADLASATPMITGQMGDGGTAFAQFAAQHDGYDSQHRVPLSLLNPGTDKGSYTGVFVPQPAPNNGLDADRFPQGDGWAVAKLKPTGLIKMRGKLADGTKFTISSALNGANGFPLYVPLYKKAGAIAGQLSFNTVAATHMETSGLIWFRPPQVTSLYPQGWPGGISLGFDGSARNVVSEPNVLPPGPATLTLTDGNLPPPGITQSLTIALKNRVIVPPGGNMTIKLKPSGEWSGSFAHPVSGKRTQIGGVVLREINEAAGFFLGPSESGRAALQPMP